MNVSPIPPPLTVTDGTTFREPWQAKAFALVVLLHREGRFAWEDWVRTLATEIEASPQRADEDADQAYHRQFLAALESIAAATGMTSPDGMTRRTEAWRRAYLHTPHGQPVDLASAEAHDAPHGSDDRHDHGLIARRAPLAVSPARSGRRA